MRAAHHEKKTDKAALLFLFTAVASWSVNTVLARGVAGDIFPMTLSFFRWVTALMVILPFALPRLRDCLPVIRNQLVPIAGLSLLSVAFYNSLIYIAAEHTRASHIALIIASTPATTYVLSACLLKDRRMGGRLPGMALSLVGVMVIIFQGSLERVLTLAFNIGDLIAYGAVFSWALYSVLLKRQPPSLPPMVLLCVTIALGAGMIFPFFIGEVALRGWCGATPKTLGVFLFLGIFPSVVSYLCWIEGVRRAGPFTAALFMNLIPVLVCIIGAVTLGERIHPYHVAGGVAILSGMVFSGR